MSNTAEASILLRTTESQRDALHQEARDAGLSLQELLELKIFGELRPRVRKRRRRAVTNADQEALALIAS